MKTTQRSLEQLVEGQLKQWQLQRQENKKKQEKPGPIITFSREPGAGGSEIARRLCDQLGMDIIGGGIIQQVAESAEMSEKVIASLDEKEITKRDDWLTSLFETRHLWPDRYLFHLTKVIGTIAHHGNTIIVGRGANYILPQNETFKVRIIAPLDYRIQHMIIEHDLSPDEAKKYVLTTEADRSAFARKYFRADWADPCNYDIIINTFLVSVDGAVAAIKAAFAGRKTHMG
ncbi:MAG: cytidylate kinase-like family protein [Smithellaceae bacterium]|nr:cytidylate kinase-like family protein [Smithellaceae bacterium]